LKRLGEVDCEILLTPKCGAVMMEVGEEMVVESWKKEGKSTE